MKGTNEIVFLIYDADSLERVHNQQPDPHVYHINVLRELLPAQISPKSTGEREKTTLISTT